MIDNELAHGVVNRKHSFHLLTLCTSANHNVSARTLVLRGYSQSSHELIFHSHAKSEKISELQVNPKACVLGYCKQENIQLRLYGHAEIVSGDPESLEKWHSLSVSARRCYLAQQPGAILDNLNSGYDKIFNQVQKADISMTEYASSNFARIKFYFDKIDFLQLAASGHIRAYLQLFNNSWHAKWIAP